MSCLHGMDGRFCALCNGACHAPYEPFGGMRQDHSPRFVKGRDKAEWSGIGKPYEPDLSPEGERTRAANTLTVQRGDISKPISAWGRTELARTQAERASPIHKIVTTALVAQTIAVVTGRMVKWTPKIDASGARVKPSQYDRPEYWDDSGTRRGKLSDSLTALLQDFCKNDPIVGPMSGWVFATSHKIASYRAQGK